MRRHACIRVLERRLHARHAKSTATLLGADCLNLSPVHGLLLSGSPALGSIWAAGEADGPAVGRLARALFNRHDSEEPLRPSRNKSQPAVHLTPALQGACLGLALRGAEAEVRSALMDLGVAALAKETKVSIVRFERFVRLLGEAIRSPVPLLPRGGGGRVAVSDAEADPVTICGITVMLAHVWTSARTKLCLLAFLSSLQQHAPHLELFHPSAAPECERWRAEFVADDFGDEVHFMLGGGSRSIPPEPAELEALCAGGAPAVPPAALERLAYTLAAREGCAPEVAQEVHGYQGQPPIADCVEACVREAIGLALWDGAARAYDCSRLPASADPALVAFFDVAGQGKSGDGRDADADADGPTLGACARADAGRVWFDLLSARGGGSVGGGPVGGGPVLDYMLSRECSRRAYELFPSVSNFAAAVASLLRADVQPPAEGAPPAPVWPGSRTVWQLEGCSRHPVLRLRSGDGPGEELKVVFNGQRHCYSLRDARATEPAWIGSVRHAWQRRLLHARDQRHGEEEERPALHSTLNAAAARLLSLRGERELARHETLYLEQQRRDEALA